MSSQNLCFHFAKPILVSKTLSWLIQNTLQTDSSSSVWKSRDHNEMTKGKMLDTETTQQKLYIILKYYTMQLLLHKVIRQFIMKMSFIIKQRNKLK